MIISSIQCYKHLLTEHSASLLALFEATDSDENDEKEDQGSKNAADDDVQHVISGYRKAGLRDTAAANIAAVRAVALTEGPVILVYIIRDARHAKRVYRKREIS